MFSKIAFMLLSIIPVLALHGKQTGHEILVDTIRDHVTIQNFLTAMPTNILTATSKKIVTKKQEANLRLQQQSQGLHHGKNLEGNHQQRNRERNYQQRNREKNANNCFTL